MAMRCIPPDHPEWKGDLQRLLKQHNGLHAKKHKTVAYNTENARANALFRIFRLLRAAGFKVGPYSLGGRHLTFLMGYWTADPAIEAGLRARGSQLKLRDKPLSAAYIQGQLSHLRAPCRWTGKDGLVRPAEHYVQDPTLVKRSTNATRDRTWSGANVDPMAVLAEVQARDPVVGLQVEVIRAFGLRRKEAVMFSPSGSVVPAYALPPGASLRGCSEYVRVKRGTKGGRVRYIGIRTDYQRQVLARARAAAPHEGMHIGPPGLTLKQALARFSNVLRRCGVTMRDLGVTGHGLRHEFVADGFTGLTGSLAPIKDGAAEVDPQVDKAARLILALEMGHGRARVVGAYVGSSARQAGNKWLRPVL